MVNPPLVLVVPVVVAIFGTACALLLWVVRRGNRWLADRRAPVAETGRDLPAQATPTDAPKRSPLNQDPGEPPLHRGEPFGYRTGWIAIRSDESTRIARELNLKSTVPLGWTEGVRAAYTRGVFMTPAVAGWTLVMGAELSEGMTSAQRVSERLGCEVQVFATERISESHLWERAGHGEGHRFFSFLEGDIETIGPLSDIEERLGLAGFIAAWGAGDDSDVDDIPDEEMVVTVAAAWSLDPNTLSDPDERLGLYSPTGVDRALLRS